MAGSFMLALAIVSLLAVAEYPLAAGFIPADPNNYVVGGLDDPQYVIIHTQEGVYEGTISWFQYAGSNVSTHYVMRASDGEITQMVEHADMAQHIGGWNPIAFGIEHEGWIDDPSWYTWEQYTASAELTRWLCDAYAIPVDRDHILGHVEVPGASHTDPGPYWAWDMYMALVHDVVPQGRVEGVLVDRSTPCVLTALEDTWITTTLEGLDALDDDEMCFLPAGTELPYLHASAEMISQRRLTMEGGGPCVGVGGLDVQAYIWAPAFTPVCDPAELAATDDVVVSLAGEVATVDATGRFVFENVGEGPHAIDVASTSTWASTTVPIDVAVYPGSRVVIALDPADGSAPDPSDGTSDGMSDGSGGDAEGDDEGSTGAAAPTPEAPGSSDDGSTDDPAIDRSSGDDAGCGCRQDAPRGAAMLWATALVALRRRADRRIA